MTLAEAVPLPRANAALVRKRAGSSTRSLTALIGPTPGYNQTTPLEGQINAFNFLLSTQVAPLAHPPGTDPARFQLIAPYARDPTRWVGLPWQDRYTRRVMACR